MQIIFFSSTGWQDWDIERIPLIRRGMPVLVDDDLRFEDEHGSRPAVVVNQWLRELPVSGAAARSTWVVYARALKGWLEFLGERGVAVFADRARLRAALGCYAEYRLAGPVEARLAGSTWNLHVGV